MPLEHMCILIPVDIVDTACAVYPKGEKGQASDVPAQSLDKGELSSTFQKWDCLRACNQYWMPSSKNSVRAHLHSRRTSGWLFSSRLPQAAMPLNSCPCTYLLPHLSSPRGQHAAFLDLSIIKTKALLLKGFPLSPRHLCMTASVISERRTACSTL